MIKSIWRNYTPLAKYGRTMSNLIITPSCVKKIKDLNNNSNSNLDARLRIAVNSGGCSGLQYEFRMDHSELHVDDIVERMDGIEVVTDECSFEFIKKSTVDYENGMMRSAFIISNNPQSELACGCGSSFAIKSFEINSIAH